MRVILFAGKGGVGKTSMAGATGTACARLGKKTLVLSLDTAHSLSDVFDRKAKLLDVNQGQPVAVAENLWIQELDVQRELFAEFGEIHEYVTRLLAATGQSEILAEDMAILPGMEEVSLLLKINRYLREKEYDVLILDSAPTGEAIRFISLPATLEWYMNKLFRMERTMVKMVRPVVEKMYKIPMPGDSYFAAIEKLYNQLKGVDQALTDPAVTTVRLVANPEKIVLKETQRASMFFALYGLQVDAVIMNRIMPEGVTDQYFEEWKVRQKEYLEQAKKYFSPLPILTADLFRGEVLGVRGLSDLAAQVYEGREPDGIFHSRKPWELTKGPEGYEMKIRLPFADKKDIRLHRSGEELILTVGALKRHILLPRAVAASPSVKARFAGKHLLVSFGAS